MYNDENREFDPVGGDLPPQPQQDRTDLPEGEPDEIVSWYTPRQEEPEEVVNYFVQQRPIPQNVWKQAAKTQRKRRRLWTWLGIGGIALVVVVIVVAAILSSTASSAPSLPGSDDGDSASSMVDIFRKKETTIPRISGEEGVKLSCQNPSGEELTIQQVYAKVNPSVVAVVAEQSDGSAAVGTGVIMTESGYIITNAHVISGGKSCWVALDTGVTYDARLVGYDEDEDLAVLRCGWRADYLLDAAEKVASGALPLEQIAQLPLPEARQALQTIRGVGPKVAECVLLYGMGRLEAFPLDVWMKRAMAVLFPGRKPEDFGPYAGIAQQYIFHFCRCHPQAVRVG